MKNFTLFLSLLFITQLMKAQLPGGNIDLQICPRCASCLQPVYIFDGIPCDSGSFRRINIKNNQIKLIDIKSDSVFNGKRFATNYGLVVITSKKKYHKTIKLINKLSACYTIRHALTKYSLNGKQLSEAERFDVLNKINYKSLVSVKTMLNDNYPEGLIAIDTK